MGKHNRDTQSQFEVLVDFMERNGDLGKIPPGPQGRLENLQKWLELSDLLNKAIGDVKPLDKWRKTWSDFKNNTRKKIEKIRRTPGEVRAKLTDVEKRVLKLIGEKRVRAPTLQYVESVESEEDDDINCKEDVRSDTCQKASSPVSYFCSVNGNASKRRLDSTSSSASSASSQPSEKRRKVFVEDDMKEIADKFLKLERDREKMAHEREMARLKQNDQFISVFGRIVNVLETLVPSIQRYLDLKTNADG